MYVDFTRFKEIRGNIGDIYDGKYHCDSMYKIIGPGRVFKEQENICYTSLFGYVLYTLLG